MIEHTAPEADPNPAWSPLQLPESARSGVPFTATIVTLGSSSCTRADGAEVEVAGLVADVTPYDLSARNAICTADLGARADEPIEVSASDLKNGWHDFLDRVARGRQELIITRYGKPIARLTPYIAPDKEPGIFGWMSGSVTVHEDIVGPSEETWEADA